MQVETLLVSGLLFAVPTEERIYSRAGSTGVCWIWSRQILAILIQSILPVQYW